MGIGCCREANVEEIEEMLEYALHDRTSNSFLFPLGDQTYSYPYTESANARDSFKYPNFVRYIDKIKAVAMNFPTLRVATKVVVVKRDWVRAVSSSCTRFGHCEQPTIQTRTMQSIHSIGSEKINRAEANYKAAVLIDEQLQKIDANNWIMLDYEDLIAKPS